MAIDWKPFVALVSQHQRFTLTTHTRPDGDGLGSVQALAEGLRRLGKAVHCVVAGWLPERYKFLDPQGHIRSFTGPDAELAATEALIVLDTGTWNQLAAVGDWVRTLSCKKAVIDHHLTQDDLGAIRFIDTSVEATGRLAYDALQALGVPLDAALATPLFVALAMDTGWFRHSNTTPATHQLAAELVAAGARPEQLYHQLFEQNSLARLRLISKVLERLTVTANGKLAHSSIIRADYETTQATPQDSEDLVNYTTSMAGIEIGLLFMEQPRGGIKVSFRSRGQADVRQLAETFGGGGHRVAAGAIVPGALEEVRTRVCDAAVELLSS
jgi:phosphoesterase RecJ-like protein